MFKGRGTVQDSSKMGRHKMQDGESSGPTQFTVEDNQTNAAAEAGATMQTKEHLLLAV